MMPEYFNQPKRHDQRVCLNAFNSRSVGRRFRWNQRTVQSWSSERKSPSAGLCRGQSIGSRSGKSTGNRSNRKDDINLDADDSSVLQTLRSPWASTSPDPKGPLSIHSLTRPRRQARWPSLRWHHCLSRDHSCTQISWWY